MEEIFLKRLGELDIEKEERSFILKNIELCTKIYFRGIRDTVLWFKK